MTLEQLIPLAINASMFLVVFSLGLATARGDAMYLSRHGSLLLRSVLSLNVAMVVFAVVVAVAFDPHPAVKIALLALAVAPVPPVLPAKQIQAGGSSPYAVALMATASLAAIVLAPAAIALVGGLFGLDMALSPGRMATIVLVSIMLPLVLGIAVRHVAPEVAHRLARPVSRVATALLVIAFLPVLVTSWPMLWTLVGNGVLLLLAAFTLIGILVGHLLGGPDRSGRVVLGLATGTRHPGIAAAVATLNFPDEKAALAVVLYHLVIGGIVAIPYTLWCRKRRPAGEDRVAP